MWSLRRLSQTIWRRWNSPPTGASPLNHLNPRSLYCVFVIVGNRDGHRASMSVTLRQAKRLIRIVIGFTILGLGMAALVLPGPGWLTIGLGLSILATEFVWARRLLDRLKSAAGKVGDPESHARLLVRASDVRRPRQSADDCLGHQRTAGSGRAVSRAARASSPLMASVISENPSAQAILLRTGTYSLRPSRVLATS